MKTLSTLLLIALAFVVRAQTVLNVGPGQTYTTIAAAYAAIPNALTGPYVISLEAGYNGGTESYPIQLTLKSGSSAAHTITIQPAVTGILIGSSDTTGTIEFRGCKYVTLDGRVNGTGTVADLTVLNTNNVGSALMFRDGVSYSAAAYVNVQAVQAGIQLHTLVAGPNTNNEVRYCNVSGIGTALVNYGIQTRTYGSQIGFKVLNSNFFNFNTGVSVLLGANSDSAVIRGNSFYTTINRTILTNWNAITLNGGQSWVYGNFIGGSAPRCAGGNVVGIRQAQITTFTSSDSAKPVHIDSNIITNIHSVDTITTAHSSGTVECMYLYGACQVGSLVGNIIGDTASNNALTFDHSGSSASFAGFSFRVFNILANRPGGIVEHNAIGGITLGDSIKKVALVYSLNRGVLSMLVNNYFGSSTQANNIVFKGGYGATHSLTYYIYNVIGNTFSNISVNKNLINFRGIDTAGKVVGNTLTNLNISCPSVAGIGLTDAYLIRADSIVGNRISSLHLTNIYNTTLFRYSLVANGNTVDSVTSRLMSGVNALMTGFDAYVVALRGSTSRNKISNFHLYADSAQSGMPITIFQTNNQGNTDSNQVENIFAQGGVTGINLTSVRMRSNSFNNITCTAFIGIRSTAAVTVDGNIISNVRATQASVGIDMKPSSTLRTSISGNKISGITVNESLNTGYGLLGIRYINGTTYCADNNISHLSYSGRVTQTIGKVVAGILSSTLYDTLKGNIVDNISATPRNGSYPVHVVGIMDSAGAGLIANNKVSHIWLDTSSVLSQAYGIKIHGPYRTVFYNNLVQVGVKSNGTVSTDDYTRCGIYSGIRILTGAVVRYFYNTVYVAGNIANSTHTSFAARLVNETSSVYDNIFINNTNSQSGTGRNIALAVSGIASQQLDYNIYRAQGTNGAIGSIDTGLTSIATLAAFRSAIPAQNLNSMDTDALLMQPLGDTVTLSLGPGTGSPAIGHGTVNGVPTTLDYYGVQRSATVPTIGAIEKANFKLPVLDSIGEVYCSTSATGLIRYIIPAGGVWDSLHVYNGSGALVTTTLNLTGTQTITQLTAGTYTLYFSSANGAVATLTAVIQSDVTAPYAPAMDQDTICAGSSTTLATSGGAGTYQWYSAATGGTLLGSGPTFSTGTVNQTTVYYVQSNPSGCPSVRTPDTVKTVQLAAPTITPSASRICRGQNIALTASGATTTAHWYTQASGGSVVASGTTYTVASNTLTTFYADYTVGSCTSPRGTASFIIDAIPAAPVLTTAHGSVCPGMADTLSVRDDGLSYSWYLTSGGQVLGTGSTYVTPVISQTQTFYVSGNDGHCTSSLSSQQVVLLSAPAPDIRPKPETVCPGETVNLLVNGNSAATWYDNSQLTNPLSTGITFTAAPVTANTVYYAVIHYPNGCTSTVASDSVLLKTPPHPVITVNGSSLTSDQPSGNEWYLNGIIIGTAHFQTFIPTVSGLYTVVYTSVYGCTDTSDAVFYTIAGIDEIAGTQIRIYPNPTVGSFVVHYDEVLPATMRVYNGVGQIVMERILSQADTEVSAESLPAGAYTLSIESSAKKAHTMLIKQ